MAYCGIMYGGRYVWWIVARSLVLLMVVLAGAMPGWSYHSITGTRIGIYHTCMRALCDTTNNMAESLNVSSGLIIANGVLSVLGPALVALTIMLMVLDIGAKGRINGTRYRTFVVLRNSATYFPFFFDLFTFSEIPVILANIVIYIVTHVLYYQDYQFYVCFFVYIVALVLLFIVDIHVLVIKLLHRRRITPPENIWNPGLLENPDLYDKGGWDLVISNEV